MFYFSRIRKNHVLGMEQMYVHIILDEFGLKAKLIYNLIFVKCVLLLDVSKVGNEPASGSP